MSAPFAAGRENYLELGMEGSLKGIEENLQSILTGREKILKTSRDCISFCSRAIVHIHTGKMIEAASEIKEAEKILKELRKEAAKSGLSRYLPSPEAEFVEASAVQAIVQEKPIPLAKDLGVSGEAYVLGLLDTVGEIKRLVLDAIMASKIERAKAYFELMESLYSLLSPFAVFDNVVGGLRRKIDVARMVTDDVRGVMAEEARRSKLLSSMQNLQVSVARKTPTGSKRKSSRH